MLNAEWNAHDCQTENCSECQVHQGDFNSSYNNPDDVHQDREAAHLSAVAGHILSERKKGEPRHFKQLHSERYSDNADAEQYADECVIEADEESAKDKPYYVSKKAHIRVFEIIPMSTQCRPCRL